MADTAVPGFLDVLPHALFSRKEWLEKTEIPRLKEELRLFHLSFSALYGIFIKQKLINEDPYKQENKITELEVPDSGPLNESRRRDQISLRLASYESQLDYLVNFYQFRVDYLNLGRVRKILGIVRYIEWTNLSPDSKAVNTKAVAEIAANSKAGDQVTLNIINESLARLAKCTASVMGILRELTVYHKENYKFAVRGAIKGMSESEATAANIKRKITTVAPSAPFYQELVDEVVNEDYSPNSRQLREAVLKSLQVVAPVAKDTKPKVDYKEMLLEGIRAIGTSSAGLAEIAQKIDENEATLAEENRGFWVKLKKLFMAMMHSEPEAVIYELTFIDPVKGIQTKESLNLQQFRADLERRIKILTGMTRQGSVMSKLKAMQEDQILGYLERTIRDVQNYYRTLVSLDEYFKSASSASREKIKGIKPELSTVKNCIVKANQIQHDYSAAKEEVEQLKRLGISSEA
jgi:hypothetical protein